MKKPVIRDIARPAGKGDDLAKLLTSVVNRAIKNGAPVLVNQPVKKAAKKAKLNRVFKGSIMPKKGGIPRKKFEKIYGLVEPNPRFASPKVQQQIARSKTKRRGMAQTTRMANKYYGK